MAEHNEKTLSMRLIDFGDRQNFYGGINGEE